MRHLRRIFAAAVVLTMTVPTYSAGAGKAGQPTGSIAGTATSNGGETLANNTVQLRNVSTGQLVGTTKSSSVGTFAFSGLEAGNYLVEVVNAVGQIVGTSAAMSLAAGAAITGVAVTATAAAVATGLSTTAIVTITTIAAAGGIAGAIAIAKNSASPSR